MLVEANKEAKTSADVTDVPVMSVLMLAHCSEYLLTAL